MYIDSFFIMAQGQVAWRHFLYLVSYFQSQDHNFMGKEVLDANHFHILQMY